MEKQEKLLLVGGDMATPHAIKYCKEIGVYTIMTNDIPYENNPFKQMADEAWEIPVEELDILEAKCREVGVTGVFAGVNEHNLDMTKALAERLDLPFYASDEGWICSRDKLRFKDHCIAVGLDVPKRYNVSKPFSPEMLEQISYPVIVKPTDSAGSRGISICQREEDLLESFDYALSFSEAGTVVVEDYIDGHVFMTSVCFLNEKPVIYDMGCNYNIPVHGRQTLVFGTFIKKNWIRFEEIYKQKLELLFERMGCTKGLLFIQGVIKDGKYYIFELGYRLDGLGGWMNKPDSIGFSPLDFQVDIALGHSDDRYCLTEDCKNPARLMSVYQVFARTGKIARIVGLDSILEKEKIRVTLNRYKVGDQTVHGNSMFEMAYCILLNTCSETETKELLRFINETLHVYDEDGNDMLYYFDDYSIFES